MKLFIQKHICDPWNLQYDLQIWALFYSPWVGILGQELRSLKKHNQKSRATVPLSRAHSIINDL